MDALLNGNEVVSGGLVLEETNRCWSMLEGESIFSFLSAWRMRWLSVQAWASDVVGGMVVSSNG